VLEEYLDAWDDALVVSSHDRYFLDRVCTDILSIEPDGSVVHHPGGWSAYREAALSARRPAPSATKAAKDRPKQQRTKLTYNDKRDLDRLTRSIPKLEERKALLTGALDDAAGDYERTLELSRELTAVLDELDTAETRWLELTEKAELLAADDASL
jgi:ABC transport system ATP-binding/permease protein